MQSGLGEREERVPFPVFVRIRAPFSDEGTQSHISIPPPPPPPSTSLHSGSSVPRRLEVSLIKHSPHERSSHVVDNSRSSLAFTFTRVFGPNSQQDEVFSESVKPHVAKCLQEGRPLCICAYGQTGSGKTYSMFGGGKYANRGIVQRTITQVFSYVDAVAAAAASSSTPSSSSSFLDDDIEDERTRVREANGASSSSSSSSHVDGGQLTLRVRLSCLQIYNEQAFDLLDERQQGLPVEKWKPLQVVVSSSSSGGGGGGSSSSMNNNSGNNSVPVRGLRVYDVASEADALTLLLLAHVNRTTAATPMNLASSRSHCLLSISVDTIASTGICLKSTQITLVDLAGSERVYKTGTGAPAAAEAAEATGSRKVGQRRTREGKMINLSLHHLQQCIVALQQQTPQHTANTMIKPSSVETQDEMNSNHNHHHHHHHHHHPRFSISSSASSSSSCFFKSRDSIGSVASSGHVSESSSIASRSRASSILSGLMAIPSAVSSSSSSSFLHNNAQSSSSSSSSSLSRHTHVPFRNSVLTIALKDFLDGKSLTVFIATLNPEVQYTDESVSTLRFAARCAVLSADVSIPKRRGTDSGNSSANTSITGAAASSLSSSAAAPPPLPPPFLSNPRGVSTSRSSDAHAKNDDASAFLRLSRDKEALIAELQRAITRAETAEGALDLIRETKALQEEREIQSALLKLNERQLRRNDTRAVYPQDALPVAHESMSNTIESHTTNNQHQPSSSSSSSLTLTEDEKKSTEEAVAHYVKVLMKSAVASAVQAAAEAIVSADNNNTAALSIAVSSSSSSSSFIQSEIDKEESHHLPYHLPTTTTTGGGVGRVSLPSSSTSTILLPSSPTHGPQLPSQFKDLLLQGQVFLKYPSSKGSSILARPGLRSLYVDKHFKALHWKHLDTHSSLLQSSTSSSEDLISDSSTGTNFGLISSIVDISDGISVSPLVDSDSNSNNASSDKRSNARRSHHHHHPSGVGGATLFITFKERVLDLEVPTLGASPEIAIRVRDLWRDALMWLAKESKVLLN